MIECPFESDVLDALASRRWPARAGEELHTHVAACDSCRDLADVAGALINEEDVAYSSAHVPSSGAVWHRAQLRAREEAARVAMRPIGFVQGLAFAFSIAAALALAVWGLPVLASLMPDLPGIAASLRAPSLSLPTDTQAAALLSNTTVQVALATWLVLLAPLAVYFALSND